MSPLMQQALDSKNARRKRLVALPYPEKVRIVERMRVAEIELRRATSHESRLREEPPEYRTKKA